MSPKRKILLVCKETYTFPMHFLAKLLRDENTHLAAFFFMGHESLFGTEHYAFFKRANKDVQVFDMKDTAQCFLENIKQKKVSLDPIYLDKIENKYSAFKHINLQLMTSQFYALYYHDRDFYYHVSYDIHLYWLQLYYQYVEKILDDFKPDVIYDSDCAEVGRVALLEVAKNRRIPYISLEYGRFGDYCIPTCTHGLKVDTFFRKQYEYVKTQYKNNDYKEKEGFAYLENFRHKKEILANDDKKINPLFVKGGFLERLISAFSLSWTTFYGWIKTLPMRRGAAPLYTHCFRRFQLHWIVFFRDCVLRWFERKFFRRIENLKELRYILFPLHVIPESTTFTKAPYFSTEAFLIEALSKAVPWNVKILVKEHWSMLGERRLSYYKKLQELPNVILISPFQDKDPKELILNSMGVVTITGTTALEAALLGNPSIIFGSTSFEILSCVHKISDVTEIEKIVREWYEGKSQVFEHELVAYIDTVFKFGQSLSLKTLLFQNPKMDVSGQEKRWLSFRRRRILKERLCKFLRLERYCSPTMAEAEEKVEKETMKLKEILETGYRIYQKDIQSEDEAMAGLKRADILCN